MPGFTPTTEQEQVLQATESAMISAGPGTGKTRTAVEKSKLYVASLDDDMRQRVLFLSFSNAAVFRLSSAASVSFTRKDRRLLRFLTYHSLAADILRHYGRFVGLPPRIRVLDKLEESLTVLEMYGTIPTDKTEYGDLLRQLARDSGLLAFDVLIPCTIRLLESSEPLRRLVSAQHPLIVVDEFQDTSADQWRLLQLMGADAQVLAFGDPNQIIYSSLHGATTRRFDAFAEWKGIEPARFSRHNFRCDNADILDFADCLLSGAVGTTPDDGNVQVFRLRYRNQLRATLALIWRAIREQAGPASTVGVLAPSNKIAEEIAVALRNPPANSQVAFPVYVEVARDAAAHDAVLLALLAVRGFAITKADRELERASMALHAMDVQWNRRKNLSPAKPKLIQRLLKQKMDDPASTMGALLGSLPEIADIESAIEPFVRALSEETEFRTSCGRIAAHGRLHVPRLHAEEAQLELFDDFRIARKPKGLEGEGIGQAKTEVMTYWRAKGREFDFVVMLVDPRGESTRTPLDEKRRLYYVCATRAKQWLGVVCYRNELGQVLGPVLAPA
jgi:superfamily I DNA/RNA helicase